MKTPTNLAEWLEACVNWHSIELEHLNLHPVAVAAANNRQRVIRDLIEALKNSGQTVKECPGVRCKNKVAQREGSAARLCLDCAEQAAASGVWKSVDDGTHPGSQE